MARPKIENSPTKLKIDKNKPTFFKNKGLACSNCARADDFDRTVRVRLFTNTDHNNNAVLSWGHFSDTVRNVPNSVLFYYYHLSCSVYKISCSDLRNSDVCKITNIAKL